MTILHSVKKVLPVLLICVGLVPVCSAKAILRRTEEKYPTAFELLDKYTEALDSLRSTIVKAEITSTYAGGFDRDFRDPAVRGLADRGTMYSRTELRTDGKRLHWRGYSWGHISSTFPSVPEKQAHYYCRNWDGEQFYSHGTAVNNTKGKGIVHLRKLPNNEETTELSRKYPASYLMGFNLESDERMDSTLRRAKSISVRPKTERIGGSYCYVIDAKTDSGRILLWIDPAHGYHPAKAEARLAPGDLVFGRHPLPKGDRRTTRLENVRFEQIDDIWVPTEADAYMDRHFGGRNHTTQKWHYKRTEVLVNPDHKALGSFDNPLENPQNDPELKNGAYVYIHGDQTRYIWQDGRVVDKDGKVIIDSTPKNKSDSKESPSDVLGKKAPTVWDLLRKERQKHAQAVAAADTQHTPKQAGSEGVSSESGPPAGHAPTATELLDKWTRALDSSSSRSFIARGESTHEHEYRFTVNPRRPGIQNAQDSGTSYRRLEYRTDGERMHLREYSWGHIRSDSRSVPQERPFYYCLNYAGGKELYRHSHEVGQPGRVVMISKVDSYRMSTLDLSLQGYILSSNDRTDSILRRARTVSVRSKAEKVGDRDCYVLDARTESGNVSLWLDPASGYHLARAEVVAGAGDLEYGQPLGAGQVHTAHFDGFRYEDVNGVWMPVERDAASDLDYGDGSFTRAKVHYRRTRILLNPDHGALGSFLDPLEHPENDPELKNGACVMRSDDRTRYLWQDGTLIPDESRSSKNATPNRQIRPPRR